MQRRPGEKFTLDGRQYCTRAGMGVIAVKGVGNTSQTIWVNRNSMAVYQYLPCAFWQLKIRTRMAAIE
jgi:hypothetical protein